MRGIFQTGTESYTEIPTGHVIMYPETAGPSTEERVDVPVISVREVWKWGLRYWFSGWVTTAGVARYSSVGLRRKIVVVTASRHPSAAGASHSNVAKRVSLRNEAQCRIE